MLSKNQLSRINELARKSKSVGLTEAEVEEQKSLREAYIKNFRAEFRKQLESIEFVDEDPRTLH